MALLANSDESQTEGEVVGEVCILIRCFLETLNGFLGRDGLIASCLRRRRCHAGPLSPRRPPADPSFTLEVTRDTRCQEMGPIPF